jgi:SAM-dependent methyltransferase
MDEVQFAGAPLKIGTSAEFALVSRALAAASFDEQTICRAFGLGDMSDVAQLRIANVAQAGIPYQLQILCRLFLVLALVPSAEIEQAFDKLTVSSFLSLGLLARDESEDNFYANVLFYPVHELVIASDREINTDGSRILGMTDLVFPAVYEGTLQFLRLLPELGGDALDLCAGTGIGAFALSRKYERAFSLDISGRATEFARFNQALNGCENVRVLQGDLYEPVHDQTFDCIVAHPPYVPSLTLETVWRDGGVTGDLFVRRIIEGLPQHLRAGGCAMMLTQGVDTKGGLFEERTRQWLGARADEFDIIFASKTDRSPEEVLELLFKKGPDPAAATLSEEFRRAGVVNMPYGALFIRRARRSTNQKSWTIRPRLSAETSGADFQATFALHDRISSPQFDTDLARAKPRLAPHLEVTVTHVVDEGSLVPVEYIFSADRPFAKRAQFDPWAIPLLTRFDGLLTVAEVYDAARAEEEMPHEFGVEHFILLVTRSIEAGFLILSADELGLSVPWAG